MNGTTEQGKARAVLAGLSEIKQYLTEHNILETAEDIVWTCPNCGTKNIGAYYARQALCAGCNEYAFPKLSSGRVEDIITEMEKQIEGWNGDIYYHQGEIAERESEIAATNQTIKALKGGLRKIGPLTLLPGSLHNHEPHQGPPEAQEHVVEPSPQEPIPGAREGLPGSIRRHLEGGLGLRHLKPHLTISRCIWNWWVRARVRMAKNAIRLNKRSPGELITQYIRIAVKMLSVMGPYAAVVMFLVYFFSAYINPDKMVAIAIDRRGEANIELIMCVGFILCMIYAVWWIVIRKERINE